MLRRTLPDTDERFELFVGTLSDPRVGYYSAFDFSRAPHEQILTPKINADIVYWTDLWVDTENHGRQGLASALLEEMMKELQTRQAAHYVSILMGSEKPSGKLLIPQFMQRGYEMCVSLEPEVLEDSSVNKQTIKLIKDYSQSSNRE